MVALRAGFTPGASPDATRVAVTGSCGRRIQERSVRRARVRRRAGATRLLRPPTGVDADAGRAIAGPPVLRPARPDDVGQIAEVLDECTRHYLGRPSSRDDALGRLKLGDPAQDFRLALDSDGNTAGFGHVWAVQPDEVRGFVRVRPSAKGRGVGAALLSWLAPRAREIAREVSLNDDAILTVTSWAQDRNAAALLEQNGFSPLRHFLQMRIDLDHGLQDPALPRGPRVDDAFRRAATMPSSLLHSARPSPITGATPKWTRPNGGVRTETQPTRRLRSSSLDRCARRRDNRRFLHLPGARGRR